MSADEPGTAESFVETAPLTDVFGADPRTRVVVAFLGEGAGDLQDFSHNELARIAGVGEDDVVEHVAALRERGVVVETDEVEGAATYRLADGEAGEALRRLNSALFERGSSGGE